MDTSDKGCLDQLMIDEIRLILDEKRTFISVMSTGIFILLSQLLINSILIATSHFYEIINVLHIIIPFYIINILLVILAGYLIIHSLYRIHHFNHLILQLKKKHGLLTHSIDE
jgi:membrane protein YdbS with pleckstrin-like domain